MSTAVVGTTVDLDHLPAVKAALDDLLSVPVPKSKTRRRSAAGKSRSPRAVGRRSTQDK